MAAFRGKGMVNAKVHSTVNMPGSTYILKTNEHRPDHSASSIISITITIV